MNKKRSFHRGVPPRSSSQLHRKPVPPTNLFPTGTSFELTSPNHLTRSWGGMHKDKPWQTSPMERNQKATGKSLSSPCSVLKTMAKPSKAVHSCNPSTWETQVGASWVLDKPGLNGKTFLKEQITENNKR